MAAEAVVSVLVPVAVAGPYTYLAPAGTEPGEIVEVPLGTRDVVGVVWDDPPDRDIAHKRLRRINGFLEVPPLPAEIRGFVDWVADYTLTARGMVLRMVLRSSAALEPEAPVPGVRRAGREPERMTAARGRVLACLAESGELAWTKSGLAAVAGVSASVVQGLVEAGTLEVVMMPAAPPPAPLDPDHARPALSAEQQSAAEKLRAAVADGASVTLIDGVTGSGKTEVYFEAIATVLAAGRQVLVLLPEIALTGAFLERFVARFGSRPAEWHSDVAPRARARVWRGVLEGGTRVVVGARSALFLPFEDLGLIVVDEEHDLAYKQEDGAAYSARDMAVVRGHLKGFPVVLSSATPSIESRVNADAGRYSRIALTERYEAAPLPQIDTIDLREHQPERGRFLAPPLVAAVEETLKDKQQALLFLNRRGYAPLTLCRTCGHRFQCPNCSAWLVEHRFRGVLMCHHCGHFERRPEACPNCDDDDSLTPVGPGIERLAEEVSARFAEARVVALSSDMVGGAQRLRQELADIAAGENDIVIGTQLIAKGHNFPFLTLVGVVDADLGLAHSDLRAAERTFQLLNQVTGRAGRSGGASRALLQTWAPDHPVMQAIVSGDREAFYAKEIEARRAFHLPPFGRLAALIVSGLERDETQTYAARLRRAAPAKAETQVLGPAEAPLAVVRGRYRYRLLVRAGRGADLQGYLRAWLEAAPAPRASLRVQIDIDPQSFM